MAFAARCAHRRHRRRRRTCVGGISWALIIGKRFYEIDVREHGSGNLGATNVFRTLGAKAAIATLVLDVAKGAAAVGFAWWLVPTATYGRVRAHVGDDRCDDGGHPRPLVLALHRLQGRQGRRHGRRRAARASRPYPWPFLLGTFIVVVALSANGVARLGGHRDRVPGPVPGVLSGQLDRSSASRALPPAWSSGAIEPISCASGGTKSLRYRSVGEGAATREEGWLLMRIAVIGAGSWGTAVSWLLGGKGHDVSLWSRETEIAEGINAEHHNPIYLPDVVLVGQRRRVARLRAGAARRRGRRHGHALRSACARPPST